MHRRVNPCWKMDWPFNHRATQLTKDKLYVELGFCCLWYKAIIFWASLDRGNELKLWIVYQIIYVSTEWTALHHQYEVTCVDSRADANVYLIMKPHQCTCSTNTNSNNSNFTLISAYVVPFILFVWGFYTSNTSRNAPEWKLYNDLSMYDTDF